MTTSALAGSENYIRLLLETNRDQAKILLANPTTKQIEAITEIAYNLLVIELPSQLKRVINKSKQILRKLAKKTSSVRGKIRILRKNVAKVLLTKQV